MKQGQREKAVLEETRLNEMDRREFIKLVAGATAAGMLSTSCSTLQTNERRAVPTTKPNLLYIFADQLRVHTTGFWGETQVNTPALDSFVKEGVNFTNAVSNTPVCTPYRACMLTGRYPHSNGAITNFIRLPDEERTFGEILKEQGYTTGYIGKWHLSGARGVDYEPPGAGRHGFDYWSSFAFNHRHNKNRYFEDAPEPIQTEGYQTDHETTRAIEFIERQSTDGPFCLFVSWGPPHPPYAVWNMPPKYLEPYGKVEEIPRSELNEKQLRPWASWQKPIKYTPRKLNRRPNVEGNRASDLAVATYYAMTCWVDDCLARIVTALENSGLADNTIVVFSSDHGEMLGSHGMRGKMIYYDESVRIPFVVRWPAQVPSGTVSDACISSVDFLPTLLGLMSVDIPAGVQGMDLSHFALGKSGPEPKGAILASYTGYEGFRSGWEYRGIRTKRYTYARSLVELWKDYGPRKGKVYKDEPEFFLFDNLNDPYQNEDLSADPKHRELREELEGEVQEYLSETGDVFQPAPYYKQFFDNGNLIKAIR